MAQYRTAMVAENVLAVLHLASLASPRHLKRDANLQVPAQGLLPLL